MLPARCPARLLRQTSSYLLFGQDHPSIQRGQRRGQGRACYPERVRLPRPTSSSSAKLIPAILHLCGKSLGRIRHSDPSWHLVPMTVVSSFGKRLGLGKERVVEESCKMGGSASKSIHSTQLLVGPTSEHFSFGLTPVNSIAWAPYDLGPMLACASSDGKVSVLTFQSQLFLIPLLRQD